MPPRASWKGFLKIAEVTCPVALYAAVSTSERIALHTINRQTGNRIRRQFVDAETGKTVERDDQVKGYEVGKDEYISVEPDEIAAVIPHGDRTLAVSAFLDLADVDDLYFDKPYYLAPFGPQRRRDVRARARRHARGQGGRDRPGRALPARPDASHPPL